MQRYKAKFLVFLLVMIATGTIGFIRCRKKDTATDGKCAKAAMYAYSDVIYVLRPKNKFDCTLFTPPDHSTPYLICFIPDGTHCRDAGVRCGEGGGSTLRYLSCP